MKYFCKNKQYTCLGAYDGMISSLEHLGVQEEDQFIAMSFFDFSGFQSIRWALSQMQLGHERLRGLEGLEMHRLLGVGGGNGYSFWPNFKRYAMLTVWEHPSDWLMHRNRGLFKEYSERAIAERTFLLGVLRAHGSWHGFSNLRPIADHESPQRTQGPLAMLTRARVNNHFLRSFWKHTPRVSAQHANSEGVLFSQGIGELPWVEQATFSIWDGPDSMMHFASTGAHAKAMRDTVKKKGFGENLFAKLTVYGWLGFGLDEGEIAIPKVG